MAVTNKKAGHGTRIAYGSRQSDRKVEQAELWQFADEDRICVNIRPDLTIDSSTYVLCRYIGITDDSCYDMHTHRPLKNSKVLELGLVASMTSVKSAKQVWEKIKSGSRFPSVLGVRLSDESKLLGMLVIADLLQPWSKEDGSIRYSFNKNLLDLVDRRSEEGFHGPLPTDTCVLTKLLGPYFCGLGKATFIIQVDVKNNSTY
ncbi:hypothetical protein BJV82DRAFT_578698 [Fennellomyces sp. T-0311]|nr:hypothetical protein BJV82DRAFT_578698 [Fennellomyces sp. T-0311]